VYEELLNMHFDILMPIILFLVTFAALILGRKAESKLKSTLEEREFKNRDVALMVAMIAVSISIIVFIPSMALLALFLFSYSSLLFTVSYAFSDLRINRLTLYCLGFMVAAIIAAISSALGVVPADYHLIGVASFGSFAVLAALAAFYGRRKDISKQKWYIGALSPALFLLLFAFFSDSFVWFPYLLDVYGIVFALLIVLYMNSLFNWKTVFIFAAFLTTMDIILVWLTQTMVQAAEQISGLGLPVLVAFPTVPFITTTTGILIMRLGLGDFFFAGILTSQTQKKYGRKIATISLLTISISFGLFELILLNPELAALLPVRALPATLPILIGWLPVVLITMLLDKRKSATLEPVNAPAQNSTESSPTAKTDLSRINLLQTHLLKWKNNK
jgi:hypothetical protein